MGILAKIYDRMNVESRVHIITQLPTSRTSRSGRNMDPELPRDCAESRLLERYLLVQSAQHVGYSRASVQRVPLVQNVLQVDYMKYSVQNIPQVRLSQEVVHSDNESANRGNSLVPHRLSTSGDRQIYLVAQSEVAGRRTSV